jgi:predicted amidohydrolase
MRIAIAQINTTVGDLAGNAQKIKDYIGKASDAKADIVLFPELAVTGYPPEDLLLKPKFVRDTIERLKEIAAVAGDLHAVVGFVDAVKGKLCNAAAILHSGKVQAVYHKIKLPNYGVFDEQRYFVPGTVPLNITIGGVNIGINICEDIWYDEGPIRLQCAAGAQLILVINASPYHAGKVKEREKIIQGQAKDNKVFIAYGNLVGGQDELIFDGFSMAASPEGKIILWSQPEIILYDDDTMVRMSYPDLVEDDGRYFVTETQKDIARVHELDPALLEGLWGQFERAEVAWEGLLLEWNPTEARAGETPAPRDQDMAVVEMPPLPAFLTRDNTRADYGTRDLRQGLALDLWLQLQTLEAGQVLVDTRVFCRARARTAPSGACEGETAGAVQSETAGAVQLEAAGIALVTTDRGTIEIILKDGRSENRWDCDPGTIEAGTLHHLVVSVDGGPKIITFIVDGRLCDGGEARQFGWGRFSPNLRTPEGGDILRIAPQVKNLRLYERYLKTSEAISNYHAGLELKGLCI